MHVHDHFIIALFYIYTSICQEALFFALPITSQPLPTNVIPLEYIAKQFLNFTHVIFTDIENISKMILKTILYRTTCYKL